LNNEKYWQKGQAIIETVLVLLLLFIFFFGIAEVARAWWLKNQLNNAARVGVRVAVVTPSITTESNVSYPTAAGANKPIFDAIWNSITSGGLQNSDTKATLKVYDDNTITGLNPGDTIEVNVEGKFTSIVPKLNLPFSFIPFIHNIIMHADTKMRYE
jgi:Flp pilus assembly protein TadG